MTVKLPYDAIFGNYPELCFSCSTHFLGNAESTCTPPLIVFRHLPLPTTFGHKEYLAAEAVPGLS